MKTPLAVLLMAALSSQAALIRFDLSPPGTDVAVGLSPSNQVPVATNSTGSGNTISGGIVLNTESNTLALAIGYGSAAGFTDLTGPAVAMHIHGPAHVGENTNVLLDLSPYHFPAVDPARGGVIVGNANIPSGLVSNLLAGLTYVNIHTTQYPGGEIRGQLVPVVATNSPPTVSCPAPSTNECGTPAMLTAIVSDPDGDALTVIWTLNGAEVQTNTLPASSPPAMTSVSFIGTLPLGTNNVGVMVIDSATNTASCSTTVVVVDTTPPVIDNVRADPNVLWPPNHRMVDVRISAHATDTCGRATWRITRVFTNEPINGTGDGDTAPDWVITGDHTLQLRAERAGWGVGRVYIVVVRAKDASGNLSEPKTVWVTVPHDRGHHP